MNKGQEFAMRTKIALTLLLAFLIISLGNPFFAVAEERGAAVIDEQKLKAMLEEFVDENSTDPIIQKYGFDMSKSFMKMDLSEETIGERRIWSLAPWTIEVNRYNEGDFLVHQSVFYGPTIASLMISFALHEDKYTIVDWTAHELELED